MGGVLLDPDLIRARARSQAFADALRDMKGSFGDGKERTVADEYNEWREMYATGKITLEVLTTMVTSMLQRGL